MSDIKAPRKRRDPVNVFIGIAVVVCVLVVAVGIAYLAGKEPPATGKTTTQQAPLVKTVSNEDTATYRVPYRGQRWLYCTKYWGNGPTTSCDYPRFYMDHPKLVKQPG